jgi:hypothetical protein
MTNRRPARVVSATLALSFVFLATASMHGYANKEPLDVIVNFGDPVALTGTANQVVLPDDVAIPKSGTVTFVVNGPGHGIAIYPVSKDTTRDQITAQLCAHGSTGCADPAFANGDHTILDGKDNIVIVTGTNPPVQRIDDPTDRLLATSTQIGNLAGVFLTGTSATTTATQLQFRFDKPGRYLVICMNRNHLLANWMFGFVDVGDHGNGG